MKKPPLSAGAKSSKEFLKAPRDNSTPTSSSVQVFTPVPPGWQLLGDVWARIISRIPEGAHAIALDTLTATDGGVRR